MVMVHWPIYNPKRKVPKIHICAKFGDSRSNMSRVIVQTKVLQTDGQIDRRTGRQTQVTTIPHRPERPRGKNGRQLYQYHAAQCYSGFKDYCELISQVISLAKYKASVSPFLIQESYSTHISIHVCLLSTIWQWIHDKESFIWTMFLKKIHMILYSNITWNCTDRLEHWIPLWQCNSQQRPHISSLQES